MEHLAKYLNRQLAIARKTKKEVAAKLAATPNDFVASLCDNAVDNRIAILQEDKEKAQRKALCVVVKHDCGVEYRKAKPPKSRGVRGIATPRYSNSDISLDKSVKNKDGILLVCNLELLWS